MSPRRRAASTAWVRSLACSLAMIRLTWLRTVPSVKCSRPAISLLESPSARSASTCSSRGVSGSISGSEGSGAGVGGRPPARRRNSPSTLLATAGSSCDSPRTAPRMASASISLVASLSR